MNDYELQDLIETGEQIKSRFKEFLKKRNDNTDWIKIYNEQIYTIEIMLDIMKEKPLDINKLLTMAEVFKKYHNFKPPVVQGWCDKIIIYFSNKNSS